MTRLCLPPFLLLALAGLAVANPLENVPTGSWVYGSVDMLKTAGLIRSVPSASRPWTRAYAARLVKEACESACPLVRDSSGVRLPDLRQFPRRSGSVEYHLGRLAGEFAEELGQAMTAERLQRARPLFRIPADSTVVFGVDPSVRLRGDTSNQTATLGLALNTVTGGNLAWYDRVDITVFRKPLRSIVDSGGIRHVPGMRDDLSQIITPGDTENHHVLISVPEAYLRFAPSWLELQVGRDYAWWGPSFRDPVMLSNHAPSFDGYRLGASFNRFKFTSITALLSPWRERHRLLSAQRLEVNFWQRLVVAFALFSVYSPDSARTKELGGYLFPLLPLYPTMANNDWIDNALVGADFALFLPHVKLYGQVMVDDFNSFPWRVDWSDTLAGGPNCTAGQVGILADLAARAALRYEYTAISHYTYYHRHWFLAYTSYDVPLGNALGPDADQHNARLDLFPSPWGYVSLLGSLTRRGSLNRGDYRNLTWDNGKPTRFHAFPTGIVENTVSVGPQLTFEPFSWLRLVSDVQWYTVGNEDGIIGARRSGLSFNAALNYRY
jgi:hypothetical protein